MFGATPRTASEWVSRFNAGPVTPREQEAFERWLAEDPQHKSDLALARMAWFIAGKLDTSAAARRELDRLNHEAALPSGTGNTLPRWFTGALAPTLSVIAIAIAIGFWELHEKAATGLTSLANDTTAMTDIDEITTYALPDGSTLTVNADSAVHIAFTRTEREVVLERGEAFFEVQHDAAKPFVVAVGPRKIVVTGTKFNVNSHESAVEVAVVEGHVNVAPKADTQMPPDALSAGDVILFPEGKPAVRRKLAAAQASAWRTRQLYFDGAALQEVLTEVNRYSRKPLIIADSGLSELPLSGSFRAGDTDAVLFSLHELYNVTASDDGDTWVLTERRAVQRH